MLHNTEIVSSSKLHSKNEKKIVKLELRFRFQQRTTNNGFFDTLTDHNSWLPMAKQRRSERIEFREKTSDSRSDDL